MKPQLPFLALITAAISLVPAQLLGQGAVPGANPSAKLVSSAKPATGAVPRLPDGHPDLGGFWSNNTAIPLERPPAFAGREFLTDEEAKTVQQGSRDRTLAADRQAVEKPNEVGDYNAAFKEDAKWVMANKRNSIITDPKDGRIPPLTPEAQKKLEAAQELHKLHYLNGPEDMTTFERCITTINSGPPMLPNAYNNNYQIVQTHDHVVIYVEMIHDVRIISLDGRPHSNVRQWAGDSRGHWEGDTLVVETTNFNGKRGWFSTQLKFYGDDLKRPDEKMTVIERFTRTAPDMLLYQFTISDPATYITPWSGEIVMRPFAGPVYEYACHEGNYGMQLMLAGARAQEKAARDAAKKGSNQ
ncbi:MAG TPA: hypothetical protein VL127_04720 [Bryobacteraceae bacterium]|jgi:hypothetical protein|nr:hypothetical protein [Bryobacteraceae bacterium]